MAGPQWVTEVHQFDSEVAAGDKQHVTRDGQGGGELDRIVLADHLRRGGIADVEDEQPIGSGRDIDQSVVHDQVPHMPELRRNAHLPRQPPIGHVEEVHAIVSPDDEQVTRDRAGVGLVDRQVERLTEVGAVARSAGGQLGVREAAGEIDRFGVARRQEGQREQQQRHATPRRAATVTIRDPRHSGPIIPVPRERGNARSASVADLPRRRPGEPPRRGAR